MRFWLTLSIMALAPMGVAGALMAQSLGDQQQALRDAKAKALAADRRGEFLRQEAVNAASAADRLVAQRAVLSADIAAAEAQIEAANARLAIISRRQREQRSLLGQKSEPMLRLNAALQQMTGRPAALMIAQPGQRADYIHLRAVMATVQPEIIRRTGALRQQIAIQNEYREQELVALKSLGNARARLTDRRAALARLEGDARNKAVDFAANAAIEYERAIAQGERAREIVGQIDVQRLSTAKAAELAALDGPLPRSRGNAVPRPPAAAYILPGKARVVAGFNELSLTGYRERGVRLALASSLDIAAPASGRISYAGPYRSYGNIVIIEHGGGWTTLVTNLASLNVTKGEIVRQGTAIGMAGEDRPEITVELRKNGRVMDIAALLG